TIPESLYIHFITYSSLSTLYSIIQKKLNFCNRFFMKACQSDLKNVWTLKIGRASCRERVEIWEGDGAVKRKRDRDDQGEQSAGERQVKSEEGHDERTKQRGIRQHQ